ncbi:hypothetical protein [Roseicella aerolata]|uniref:Uncharacterized protein n=1 Tax=Roseicella aerolata TaxID=2883479 RepID=A0A9X1IG64_9PROT|nr:hypothetical protein [Roseicella aerolata]MCB4823544.1 hypothetical protein [Roseicella aerolata]
MSPTLRPLGLLAALLLPSLAAQAQGTTRGSGAQMSVGAIVLPPSCWNGQTLSSAEQAGCAAAISAARQAGLSLPPAAATYPPAVTTETDAQGNVRILRLY